MTYLRGVLTKMDKEKDIPKENGSQTVATPEEKAKLLKTITDLQEALKTIPENVGGLSERIEKIEKQLLDVQELWKQPVPRKQAVSYSETGDFTDVVHLVKSKGLAGLEEAVKIPVGEGASHKLHRFKELWDNLWITHQLLNQPDVIREKASLYRLEDLEAYKAFDDYIDQVGIKDALATSLTGAGSEWSPQLWSSEMQEFYRLARNVPEIFTEAEMPSDSWVYPLQTSGLSTYNAGQATSTSAAAVTSSTIGTSNITFTAQKPAVRMLWSGELDENSIIPILPTLRQEIPAALAEAREDAIINGVRAGTTHLDTDIEALGDDDHRKMWNGLRQAANAQSAAYDVTTGTTVYAYSDHSEIQALMGKYAGFDSPLEKFAWIASMRAYLKAGAFDELTKANFVTAQYATILRGTVNFINGSPVLVSDKVRQDVNTASGVYDGVTTTGTMIIGVYRPGFKKGLRRRQTLEVVRIARTDQWEVVAMTREDFQAMHTNLASGESLAGYGYAIT